MILIALLPLFLLASLVRAEHIVLEPLANQSGNLPHAALVLVPGAQIPPESYVPLLTHIQEACRVNGIALHAVAVQSPYDIPPINLLNSIKSAVHMLDKTKMEKYAPIFLAGHSLGGAIIQDILKGDQLRKVLDGRRVRGAVFLSSVLRRKFRPSHNGSFVPDLPTLTVTSTRDGLLRLSRSAEAFYHAVVAPSLNGVPLRAIASSNAVITIEGASHSQFSGGYQPAFVKTNVCRLILIDKQRRFF